MSERKRNARSRRSVEAILDAAMAAFAEQGIEQTSIDEIARRAAVARATVYYNFASKDEIAVRIAERFRAAGYAAYIVSRDAGRPARELIVQFYRFAQHWVAANREVAQVATLAAVRGLGRNADRPPTREVLLEIVRQGQREGTIARRADPLVLTGLLSSLLFQAPLIGPPPDFSGETPWLEAMLEQVLNGGLA